MSPAEYCSHWCSLTLLRLKYSPYLWEKALWVTVLMLEGVARLRLNYHTLEQVLVGTAVGIVFFFVF